LLKGCVDIRIPNTIVVEVEAGGERMTQNAWQAFLNRALGAVGDPELRALNVLTVRKEGDRSLTVEGRYVRVNLHASGGIGRVWLAHDTLLDREVAVKELLPARSDDSAARLRFLREARITSRLEHPGVVPIYELDDSGRHGSKESPSYAMRFVRGKTLFEATREYHAGLVSGKDDPQRFRELLLALLSVANTMAFAHSKGVAHRDLKGHNVVLGPFGEVLVLDWGLAKIFNGEPDSASNEGADDLTRSQYETADFEAVDLTREGQMVGTPAYAAPEQAEGRLALIDARTDVYGLGAILYDVLAGRAPFVAANTKELLRKVVNETPEPPSAVRSSAPPDLSAVCLKALSKRREDRYQSAAEFAEEINRHLADEPVRAYREPVGRRISRWARRHRTAVRAAGVVLVLSVVGLSTALHFVGRERDAKAVALDDANENFLLARKAVDRLLIETGDSPELKQPGLDGLRRRLLDSARDFYEQLRLRRDRRGEMTRELAVADVRLAAIDALMGRRSAAIKSIEAAVESLRKVVHANPDDDEAAAAFGGALYDFAQHRLVRNDLQQAHALFDESLAVRQGLHRRRPYDLEIQGALALSHGGLGQVLELQRRLGEAISHGSKALEIQRHAFDADPNGRLAEELLALHTFNHATRLMNLGELHQAKTGFKKALAHWESAERRAELKYPHYPPSARLNLCVVHYRSGDLSEATKQLQSALAMIERLIEKHPTRDGYKDEYATALANFGALADSVDDRMKLLLKGHAYQSERVARDPNVPRAKQLLAQIKINLSAAYFELKQYLKGLEHARDAVKLLDEVAAAKVDLPDLENGRIQAVNNYVNLLQQTGDVKGAAAAAEKYLSLQGDARRTLHFSHARSLALLGDYRRSASVLDSLAVNDPADTPMRLELRGCAWSLTSGAVSRDDKLPLAQRTVKTEQYAQYAMRDVRAAAEKGRFNDAANLERLKTDDPDYNPLRNRQDFQALVEEIAAKAKTSTP
jgi:serine/threonine protein kinase